MTFVLNCLRFELLFIIKGGTKQPREAPETRPRHRPREVGGLNAPAHPNGPAQARGSSQGCCLLTTGPVSPSLSPRRWIDALDATFHCEAPLRRPEPLSGEASFRRKPLFRAEAQSDRPGAEVLSVPRPLNKAGCRWSPALPGRTGKLETPLRLQEALHRTLDEPPYRPCAVQPTPGSRARTCWPLGSLSKSGVYRAIGRIAAKAGRRPCPGASNNPKHRNGAASRKRLPSPTQNPTDKP